MTNRRQFLGASTASLATMLLSRNASAQEVDSGDGIIVSPIGGVIQAPSLDQNMVSVHSINGVPGQEQLSWLLLGNLPNGDEGGLGFGNLKKIFGKVGAVIEGAATETFSNRERTTGTVTKPIYVLDVAAGANNSQVVLNTFQRQDIIGENQVDTKITLVNAAPISELTGGKDAQTSFIKIPGVGLFVIATDKNPNTIVFNPATQKTQNPYYYGNPSQQQGAPSANETLLTYDRNNNFSITAGTGETSSFSVISIKSVDAQVGFGGYDGSGTGFLLNPTVPLIAPSDNFAINTDAEPSAPFAKRNVKSPRGFVLDLSRS